LKKCDFLTRDQLRNLCKLGTVRNTNRVLLELSEYLLSIRDGYQSIYYLSKEGREYVDCQKIRKKGGHVAHAVMRNQLWLYSGSPHDWKNEVKVSDGETTLIVDAMYKSSIQHHFLEVDHLQPMSKNRDKIKKYLALYKNGLIAESLGEFPVLVWLTTTEMRRKQLQEACKELPIVRVYTIVDIM
jgi:hypothetical protein